MSTLLLKISPKITSVVIKHFAIFWRQHPALLLGLAMLLGCHAALHPTLLLLIPFTTLMIPLALTFFFPNIPSNQLRSRLGIACIVLIISYSYVTVSHRFETIPSEGIKGTAHITIQSISITPGPFKKNSWIYRGKIHSFISEENPSKKLSIKNVPFCLHIPERNELYSTKPNANFNYLIHAQLLASSSPDQYILIPQKNGYWTPLPSPWWCFPETRFHMKDLTKKHIASQIEDPNAARFLSGIVTGEFDDRQMQTEFGRFGLQHIMAISGFHFSIIAAILCSLCRSLLSQRKTAFLLIGILSGYFIFLGSSASILRAWITALIVLIGILLGKRPIALNSLGIALIVIFLIDPLLCCSLGFELSFLSTAAILFFFECSDFLLQKIWQKRPLSVTIKMNIYNHHGIIILNFFRQAIALTLAVHLVALPAMLFYFHKFPWIGFIYNLFFPFLVSISMLLLILGVLASFPIASLGTMIHQINNTYTHFLLNFTSKMPPAIDVAWRIHAFPSFWFICYLCLLFWVAVFIHVYMNQYKEKQRDFAFL